MRKNLTTRTWPLLRFDYKGRANAATTSREIGCDDPAPFDSKRAELTCPRLHEEDGLIEENFSAADTNLQGD